MDGVRVVRVPVLLRVSKGVVMPILPWLIREVRRHDAVGVHLPQLDGGIAALVGRLFRRRTVLTYHCNLLLPAGVVNRLAGAVVRVMNRVAAFVSAPDHRLHAGLRRPHRTPAPSCVEGPSGAATGGDAITAGG